LQWGNGVYYFRARVDVIEDGKPERKLQTFSLGAIPKRDAQAKMRDLLVTINRADYMIKSQINVGAYLDEWDSRHIAKQGKGTQGKYRSHLKNHIRPAFGKLMLCDLKSKMLQEWLDSKLPTAEGGGLSWSTRTDLRNILSGMFTQAIIWEYWDGSNPVEHVHAGRKRMVREKRKLTDDQTRRLLAELPYDVRVLCCVCLFCTLRISEVLGLQEKHLDFTNKTIQVRQRYYRGDLDLAKNLAAERDLPMAYLVNDLRNLCKGDPERFVFQIETFPKYGTEEAVTRDDRDINRYFVRPAAKRLGIYWKGFGFHALRREAITALNASLGMTQTMKMSGHSSADMSILYTLPDLLRQSAAIEARHEAILGKAGVKIQ
jgi:integrase